jgi:hypothetical protein
VIQICRDVLIGIIKPLGKHLLLTMLFKTGKMELTLKI